MPTPSPAPVSPIAATCAPWIAQGEFIYKLRLKPTLTRNAKGSWMPVWEARADGIPVARAIHSKEADAREIVAATNHFDGALACLARLAALQGQGDSAPLQAALADAAQFVQRVTAERENIVEPQSALSAALAAA